MTIIILLSLIIIIYTQLTLWRSISNTSIDNDNHDYQVARTKILILVLISQCHGIEIQFRPSSLFLLVAISVCTQNCVVFNDPYNHVLSDETQQLLKLTENIELMSNDIEETV